MRRWMCLVVGMLLASSAYADLQNVQVGGELRIRGRYWNSAWTGTPVAAMPVASFGKRPIGPFGNNSVYDWSNRGSDMKFVEQRTLLNVSADFTDHVAAFIEFEDYERWGQDFRSNYLTGVDARAVTTDDIEVFQAYIDVNALFGQPLRLRIGRQEITEGKSWLIGSRVSPCMGISYDGVKLTYAKDKLTIDAWWTKLMPNALPPAAPTEEDGDVDYYGVYGTYKFGDELSLSGYWVWIRDPRSLKETKLGPLGEGLEKQLGLDDYGVTNLHTVGLRAWGKSTGFDYDLELAYQFGDADQVGILFKELSLWGLYGDDRASFGNWAGDLEAGYTFDVAWKPRVFAGGAYFEGQDNRSLSFWDWLNPFNRSEASVSFDRLFSGIWYCALMDILGGASDLTNFYQIRAGVTVQPTDAISTGVILQYYGIVDPFDWPASIRLPGVLGYRSLRFPIAPPVDIWTKEASSDIGWLTHLWVKYVYSKDWWVRVGWEHLFTGDGLGDGSFDKKNGLEMNGGVDQNAANYIYIDTQLLF